MTSYRNNKHDLNYYGSDLNKFIDEYCTRKMTAINIDLLTYKRSLHHLRVIESKHENENIPPTQYEALKMFSNAIIPEIKFGVYVIRGNYPYDTAEIHDLRTNEREIVDRVKLIEFLNYTKNE